MTRSDLFETISAAIGRRFDERERTPPELSEASPIDGRLGLDSLDWAVVIVELENELRVDPFAKGGQASLDCLGDLVDLYHQQLSA